MKNIKYLAVIMALAGIVFMTTGCLSPDQSNKAVGNLQDAGKKVTDTTLKVAELAPTLVESVVTLTRQVLDGVSSIGNIIKPAAPAAPAAKPTASLEPVAIQPDVAWQSDARKHLWTALDYQEQNPKLAWIEYGHPDSPNRIVEVNPLK